MNRVYRDQIAKSLSPAFSLKSGWDDTNAAEKALEWFLSYLQSHLAKCPQTENTGVCDLTWKHENCALIMHMIYDITGNEKYKPKYDWD